MRVVLFLSLFVFIESSFSFSYDLPLNMEVESKNVQLGCEGDKNELKILYISFVKENINFSVSTSRAIETEHCIDWIRDAKKILKKNKKVVIGSHSPGSVSDKTLVYFHPILKSEKECISYFLDDCPKKNHEK